MPGRQNTLHKLGNFTSIPKSQSSEVATPETSQNSLLLPAALKEKEPNGRLASYQPKVSESYCLLLRNYPSESNKLFIHGLETPPRFFGAYLIGRTGAHYSAIADDKLVTLISLVKMWPPQQKVQCVLWLTGFKSVKRVQRHVRTEWNVVTGLPNKLIMTPTK
ncbi:uncharacterized protein TNCV_1577751 [Trichonephila clavipes]|nr:uncharacterized protein TNCV_1577751 [Trichonephila clavipes]